MADLQNMNLMRFNGFKIILHSRPEDEALFRSIVTIKEVHRLLLGIVKCTSYHSKKRFVDSKYEIEIGVIKKSRRSFPIQFEVFAVANRYVLEKLT